MVATMLDVCHVTKLTGMIELIPSSIWEHFLDQEYTYKIKFKPLFESLSGTSATNWE